MELSDGLFTVKCECGIEFPAEDGKCSCGKQKGDLKLDIDKFLDRVYSLHGKEHDAIDVVLDVFWNLHNKFDIMNDVLSKADVSKLEVSVMLAFLTQTFKYDKQVPNHADFCNRIENRLRELGESEARISSLLSGLRGSGKYWENMAAYGAPDWLSGPKP